MSVKRHRVCAVLLAAMLPWAAFAQAEAPAAQPPAKQSRALITKAEQLAKEPSVRRQVGPYQLAASAMYIAQQCRAELALSDAQVDFISAQFQTISKQFMQALEETYVSKIMAPPELEMRKDFARYMKDQQQPAINDTASSINAKGCDQQSQKKIIAYFDALQKQNAASQQKDASTAEPKTP